MAQQIINIGTADNDGTGDPLRTSFNKTNQNFTELYAGGATIANDVVTYAKMQNVSAASKLLGRGSAAGAGDPEEITLGTNLAMAGTTLNATGGSTTDPTPPQGRLTLQTATPVMITTQSAKTTIFYTPYVGNNVPIYDGTNFSMSAFSELSVLTTDTTKSPAAIGASKVNDWFVWNDAGTLRIGHGPDWTSDTVRSAGTALVMVNGILLNNAAITNGPAASRGTYVGTTRSGGASTLDWIYGAVIAGGTAGFFNVWNAYNRVNVASMAGDTADSWTLGTAWASNAIATRHSFVSGLAEDAFDCKYMAFISNGVNFATAGIGFDVTNAFSGTTGYVGGNVPASSTAFYSTTALGFHFFAALEIANGTGSIAFGDAGLPALLQSGIWFSGKM